MKATILPSTFLATLAGATFALAAPAALAQEKTSQQLVIEQKAAEGPEAVRRYIHRTRMIYALTFADFYVVAD